MNIFQALKRHPEISIVFLGSFLLIFALLDGPIITYALSNTAIGKIFVSQPVIPKLSGVKSYNTVIAKPKISAADTKTENNYSQDLLTIPKISVSSPIVYSLSDSENDIQKDLEKGVAHFNGTMMPGEKGKILIIGHSSVPSGYNGSYGMVFTTLNDLENKDEINIYSKNKRYTYQVFKKEITEPVLKKLEEKTDDSILVLMTCWPPGTSWKRLFIYAKLIN